MAELFFECITFAAAGQRSSVFVTDTGHSMLPLEALLPLTLKRNGWELPFLGVSNLMNIRLKLDF